MEKIKVNNLKFAYPLCDTYALDNVSFSVEEGDFVVLCGKSGCGKSTLLRHLKKSLIPYGDKEGDIYYEGKAIEDLDSRVDATSIGFVSQNPDNQLVTDKVWHELAFGLENLGLENSVIKRRVAEMAAYFGIEKWFRKDVSKLSGGQKQLLNLASVMAMQPEVLVLDEPASQLDPIAANDFLNTIYKINQDLGVTVIISEHRLEQVFTMADKVVVMDRGKIVYEGSPRQVAKSLEGREKPHPMYYGLPEVMRIFSYRTLENLEENNSPLTIREGRLLLDQFCNKNSIEVNKNINNELFTFDNEDIILRGKNLHFRYEKNLPEVIKGLNIEIPRGKIFCLLGGNGSGKSTTLKALMGILKLQKGKLYIEDNLSMALVPQNPQALLTEITVEEELYQGLELSDKSQEEKIALTEDMLRLMEIEHLREKNPYDLSGGEMQRLAVGKVMINNPDLLFLDEPTKGLDPFFKIKLGQVFRNLVERGKTLFIVSHDIEFCAEYGHYCGLFFDGEITSLGRSEAFFRGNNFYTTSTNKIFKKWDNQIVRCKEAKLWIERQL